MACLKSCILASLLLVLATPVSADSRPDVEAEVQILQLEKALRIFRIELGRYPTTEEGLAALVSCPPTFDCELYPSLGYVKPMMLIDPWDEPIRYEYPPSRNSKVPDVWTLGADSRAGGTGLNADCGNWPGGFEPYALARAPLVLRWLVQIVGASVGLAIGLPFYIWRVSSRIRGGQDWRSSLLGRRIAGLAGLAILGAILLSIGVAH